MLKVIKSHWIFYSLIFLFFIDFFSVVHPLVPFDMDDWINMGLARPGYPSLDPHVYNPAKILPEILQPLTAKVAAYVIAPVTGDYIGALTWANAIMVSLFIVLFLYEAQRLIEQRFQTGRWCSFALILLFTLFHFQFFRTDDQNNDYLWYATDPTCFFHYVIPDLLCAALVLWLMRNDIREVRRPFILSLLLLAGYLALCSNLYASVILIAYIGSVLVVRLCRTDFHQKGWLSEYVRDNLIYLAVILFWLVIQWFEANGRRASHTSSDNTFLTDIWLTCRALLSVHCNVTFVIISLLAIIGAKVHHYLHRSRRIGNLGRDGETLLLSLVFSSLYLLLLSAKVGPNYIQRPGVIFAFVVFYLIISLLALAYLCRQIPGSRILLPLLICFVYCDINTRERTFKDVHYETGTDIQTCIRVNNDIVHQVQLADARGETEAQIDVPRFNEEGNWPLALDCSCYLGRTLYKHNMTRRLVETYFNPTEQ